MSWGYVGNLFVLIIYPALFLTVIKAIVEKTHVKTDKLFKISFGFGTRKQSFPA